MTLARLQIPDSAQQWMALQRPVSATSTEGDHSDMLWDDVEQSVALIPDKVSSVIDIGCGVGLSTMHIRRCMPWLSRLAGLDGTGRDDVRSGYGTKRPWNDTSVTRELWDANGAEDVELYNIGEVPERKFDAAISFAAWGWHFPLSTYRAEDFVIPGGIVAVDMRSYAEKAPSDWRLLASRSVNRKRTFCVFRLP